MAKIEAASKLDGKQRWEELRGYVGMGDYVRMDDDEAAVWQHAQEETMRTGGYGQYCQEKMVNLLDAVRSETNPDKKRAIDSGIVSNFEDLPDLGYGRMEALEYLKALQYLPSAESVAALAYFLDDPEGRDGKTILGDIPEASIQSRSISGQVASMLDQIGIEKPPTANAPKSGWERVDAWKDWWNEVKAGKRTYRFKGSPIEYGPDGPVAAQAVMRPERNSTKTTATQPESAEIVQNSKPEKIYWMVGGSILLILIAGWRALAGRRA